jgi:hypothetical protein
MFHYKTVFVLGAGASHEFNLPVGSTLGTTIGTKCDIRYQSNGLPGDSGDIQLWDAIAEQFQTERREYQHAAWKIRDGIELVRSIDDFLDAHEGDHRIKLIGKTAIAKSILEAERNSTLNLTGERGRERMSYSTINNTWLIKFLRLLSAGVPIAGADTLFNNVSFVVFNYDRCLEHFLTHALIEKCQSSGQAAEIISEAKIFHPYGTIGALPGLGEGAIAFGESDLHSRLINVAENIRTYTERTADYAQMNAMHQSINEAEQMVFLGFGFHHQNMQLLTPPAKISAKKIIATAQGISKADCKVVRQRIKDMFAEPYQAIADDLDQVVIRNDLGCAGLFDEYALTLQSA